MREQLRQQYDDIYAKNAITYGDGLPEQLVTKLPQYLATGTVCDVGGGEGRDALYLAKQGFDVTVADFSSVGLANLAAKAQAESLLITTKQEDVVEHLPTETYDAFVFSFVLHHINAVDVDRILKACQEKTAPDGCHVIATFAARGALYERNQIKSRFYATREYFETLYQDWDIVEYAEYETLAQARHKDGSRMKNDVISLIAQKPPSTSSV